MASQILINVRPNGTRVAVLENGEVKDYKVEARGETNLVGSVFVGKVVRVLPGMQAAFVDIGLERAAFLYVGDVRPDMELDDAWGETVEDNNDDDTDESKVEAMDIGSRKPQQQQKTPIQDLLKEGQLILVQVAKAPLGTKGARVTTHISLPGRYVVYMPTVSHVGVSRRIENEQERERLRAIVEQHFPSKGGIIVRTAGEGASEDSIKEDIKYLLRVAADIMRHKERKKTPGIVYSELDVELRAVRDYFTEDVNELYVDDLEVHKKILRFVTQFMPKIKNKILFYKKEQPILDLYGVDMEISRSLGRKIWLKSGGYIIIDEAEALVAIDVNTGSFVGKRDLEDTILKTNLEAVKEIAHQLIIRNCGGIIIIDFIDMERDVNREKVLQSLKEELAHDRARTTVYGMSQLGLVEMTRKRAQASLIKSLCEPCPYCDGKGYIKRKRSVAMEIFRELEREGRKANVFSTVVNCHPEIADWIYAEGEEMLEFIEKKLDRRVVFKVDPSYHIEQFHINSVSA